MVDFPLHSDPHPDLHSDPHSTSSFHQFSTRRGVPVPPSTRPRGSVHNFCEAASTAATRWDHCSDSTSETDLRRRGARGPPEMARPVQRPGGQGSNNGVGWWIGWQFTNAYSWLVGCWLVGWLVVGL